MKYGISDTTYYNWKAKCHGMELSDLKRLRLLEEENKRLKHIVADQALDIQALKHVFVKNIEALGAKEDGLRYTRALSVQGHHDLSEQLSLPSETRRTSPTEDEDR
jgi:hypothetical protein